MDCKNYDLEKLTEVKRIIDELYAMKVKEQEGKPKVECAFNYRNWHIKDYVYTCYINNKIIPSDKELNIFGEHMDCKTNQDVKAIYFNRCSISKVPQGLTKIFPNAKLLSIAHTNLHFVERCDLIEYKDFINISFRSNEITYVPGNLFNGMTNLESIWINKNKILDIGPNFLDGLEKLKIVNLKGNSCIDKCFDAIGNEGNAALQEIKERITIDLRSY